MPPNPELERGLPTPGAAGVPLPMAQPTPISAPRDFWLRVALFATLLGAVLTAVYAWVLARADTSAALDAAGFASFQYILVPLLALTALVGVLLLERSAVLGMILLLAGASLSLGGGGVWLLPGAVLGCIWAARHSPPAQITLGFLLLVPGIAAGYYGVIGTLSYLSQIPAQDAAPNLAAPLSLAQAMAPLELLPLAVLGAWLLVERPAPR